MDKKIQEMLSNKEFFEKIYDEFSEEREHASDRVVKSYKELNNVLRSIYVHLKKILFVLHLCLAMKWLRGKGY